MTEKLKIKATKSEIITAFKKLITLQCHYAGLLNQYDNGQRRGFKSVEEYILRLRSLADEERRRAEQARNLSKRVS